MTTKHINPAMTAGVTGGINDAVLALVAGALETLWTWNKRHETRAALAKLDGRMMADVGISADMAGDELSKPFWRA